VPVKNSNLRTRTARKRNEPDPVARDSQDEFANDCRRTPALDRGNQAHGAITLLSYFQSARCRADYFGNDFVDPVADCFPVRARESLNLAELNSVSLC
jgi:hypothetical protein